MTELRMITPADDDWPLRLFHLAGFHEGGMPEKLWINGTANLQELAESSVSIVGSRACSYYGEHIASELANQLSLADFTVVSGGAYGIDAAAHRGALAADKPTVAVVANGADIYYPRGNAALFDRIVASGGLIISEQEPGSSPTRDRFLQRNRLIAALSRGTLVVEAAVRSGAMVAARRAEELHRPLMAVPGPITSATSAGPHELIREGRARLVTSAEDVAEYLS